MQRKKGEEEVKRSRGLGLWLLRNEVWFVIICLDPMKMHTKAPFYATVPPKLIHDEGRKRGCIEIETKKRRARRGLFLLIARKTANFSFLVN